VARVEAERDLVPKPAPRKSAHRRRRGDAEKHRGSVDQAGGLVDNSPIADSRGGRSRGQQVRGQHKQHERYACNGMEEAFAH